MKQTCAVVFVTALLLSVASTPTLAKAKKTKQPESTPAPVEQTVAPESNGPETSAPAAEDNSLVARARALEAEQQYDQAIALYREHLTQQPMDDEARALLAQRFAWQEKYDEAVTLYEEILHRYPQDGDIRVALARVKAWQKHYSEAQKIYEQELAENPHNVEAKHGLADVFYWKGDHKRAISLYEQVFAATQDPEVQKRLESLHGGATQTVKNNE